MTFSFSNDAKVSGYTDLENAFISEYLPNASGDAVKVYVYGLYLCNTKSEKSIEDFASSLNLSVDTVKNCFLEWEEYGLVSVLEKEENRKAKFICCMVYYVNDKENYTVTGETEGEILRQREV